MTMCGYQTIDAFVEALLMEAHVAVVTGAGLVHQIIYASAMQLIGTRYGSYQTNP